MNKSINDNTKSNKRGRPITTGKGQLIGVRMQLEELSSLDAWIKEHSPEASRPEAIRAILKEKLR